MPITINFDKVKAERMVDCLSKGKPIGGILGVDDILGLAGACFFMAMSQAPALHQAVDWERLAPDARESTEDSFFADLHAAIEYYGQLTMLVAAGEYDDQFERLHQAIVMVENDRKTVIPVKGVRDEE
jgi:hypothetical protein